MSSFIDKLRDSPQGTQEIIIVGVDPDVSIAGVAEIRAQVPVTRGVGAIKLTSARMVAVRVGTKRTGHERAADASAQIQEAMEESFGLLPLQYRTIIETSEIYANRGEDWHVVISKANACIQLALVAGGVLALCSPESTTRMVLPREWKGQASKAGTAFNCGKRMTTPTHRIMFSARTVGGSKTTPWVEYPPSVLYDEKGLPKAMEHAVDALGIAFHGLDEYVAGVWA